jgi:hypothetical protein
MKPKILHRTMGIWEPIEKGLFVPI